MESATTAPRTNVLRLRICLRRYDISGGVSRVACTNDIWAWLPLDISASVHLPNRIARTFTS